MEVAIRNCLTSREIFPFIFGSGFENILIRKEGKDFNFDVLGNPKWLYQQSHLADFERLYTSLSSSTSLRIDDHIILQSDEHQFKWNKDGMLIGEIYYVDGKSDRMIRSVKESKLIHIGCSYFIYNLESYLTSEFCIPSYEDYHPEDIANIAKGNLNLVKPNSKIFFYIDDGGFVNAAFIYYCKCCQDKKGKYDPIKLKDESEKLRMDNRNYRPDLTFNI